MGHEVTRIILPICIILSFLCSCDDFGVASRPRVNYFPLELGNEWTFEYHYRTDTSADTAVRANYKITVAKTVDGKGYYAFDRDLPFFPYNLSLKQLIGGGLDTLFIRPNNLGDVMLHVDQTEWLYLSFDASLLGSMVKSKIHNADYYLEIESTQDTVSTPMGVFHDCYRILNYFPAVTGTEHYTWFASGYGPVKIYYPELEVTGLLVNIETGQNH